MVRKIGKGWIGFIYSFDNTLSAVFIGNTEQEVIDLIEEDYGVPIDQLGRKWWVTSFIEEAEPIKNK